MNYSIELAIDIGSSKTTICNSSFGVLLKEPTVIVCRNKSNSKLEAVAIGNDAVNYTYSTPLVGCNVVYPFKDGRVVNPRAMKLLLSGFIDKAKYKTALKSRMAIMVTVPCGMTAPERNVLEECFTSSGYTNVYIIESGIAVNAHINHDNALIVNMGADCTDICVINKGGMLCGCTLNIAGNLINNDITNYFIDTYKVTLGKYSVERAKINVGSMYGNDISTVTVQGRDSTDNPVAVEMTATDIRRAISNELDKLIDIIDKMLCALPNEIVEDISAQGMYLVGGTAYLQGLKEYFEDSLQFNVTVISSPDEATASGAAMLLSSPEANHYF